MSMAGARNLLARLAQVPDPHGHQGRRHPLSAMLATPLQRVAISR